jgi:hypothetical protein
MDAGVLNTSLSDNITMLRNVKASSRLFLKLLKESHSQFLWSRLGSCLPIPTEEEYQNVKDQLIKMSLLDNYDPTQTSNKVVKIATKIFGQTMVQVIKNKHDDGLINIDMNNDDSDCIMAIFDNSENDDSSRIL